MSNSTELSCSASASLRLAPGSGEDANGATVAIGIGIGLLASIGINLGQNIQNSNADDPRKASRWWFGFTLFVVSAIANFVAFAFAPASVLAPLEGAQFVTNFAYGLWTRNKVLYNSEPSDSDRDALLAKSRTRKAEWEQRGEEAGWRRWAVAQTGLGTALVVTGIILPIVKASSEVAVFDEEAIWCFWRGTAWWIYFIATGVTAVVCFGVYRLVRPKKLDRDEGERDVLVRPTNRGFIARYFGPKTELRKKPYSEIKDVPANHKHDKLHMVLFAVPSAILGAFAVVQAKAISELVEPIVTDGEFSVLTGWLFYQCVLFIIIGLGPWFVLLSQAPYFYEVLAILPLMQGCYIIFSSIGGGIFFEEFNAFSDDQVVFFAIGLSLIVVGMFLIIPAKPKPLKMETGTVVPKSALTTPLLPDSTAGYTVVVGGYFMPIVLYPVDRTPATRTGKGHTYTAVATEAALPQLFL
jgi:hypothetical protein